MAEHRDTPAAAVIPVDWALRALGFEPGEIERRRCIQRHHHLINPVGYTPDTCRRLDYLLFRLAWDAHAGR